MQLQQLLLFAPNADGAIATNLLARWSHIDYTRLGGFLRRVHFLAAIAAETNGLQTIPATGMLHEAGGVLPIDEALFSATEFWSTAELKVFADQDDLAGIRTAMGTNVSLGTHQAWVNKAKEIFI